MTTTISADNGSVSGSAGLKSSADSSGILQLQSGANTAAVTIDASQNVTFANQLTYSAGTANGVVYLNGSKVLTTGTALVFDGTNLGVGVTPVASNGLLQLGSYGSIQALMEKATISATAATGTVAFDAITQAVLYYTTSASANWTLNVRGNSGTALNTIMQTGQSITVAFLVTQGATAYYNNVFQVDGSAITPKWQGGTAPTSGNVSGVDAYTYTIVKTGSAAFTVFASQVQFK